MSIKFQDFKDSLVVEGTEVDVNSITNKEKAGSTTDKAEKGAGDKAGSNKGSISASGKGSAVDKVNSITKKEKDGTLNDSNNYYSDFKKSLQENRLKKSAEICDAIIAQTDNKEIIDMAKGIKADIAKDELTPKQSEWIYKTSTSFKK